MSDSLIRKVIEVRITLGTGLFGAQKGNTKIIRELRTDCDIEKNGHPSKNMLKLKIYGMKREVMDLLTATPFGPKKVRKDHIQVLAGDTARCEDVIFEGEISAAWASYQQPPNLYFRVEALAGYYHAIAPSTPRSYQGSVDVASVMKDLAAEMGYSFENWGVDTKLSDPYLPGPAWSQAAQLAEAANIEFGIDDGVLFICKRRAPRVKINPLAPNESSRTAPLISKDTGMISYPVFGKKGIKVETLFNPAIKFGGIVKVESSIAQANYTWKVDQLHTHLQSETPGGKWMQKIHASRVGV